MRRLKAGRRTKADRWPAILGTVASPHLRITVRTRTPGSPMSRWPSSYFTMSNSVRFFVPAAHCCARVLAFRFASIPKEGWAERRQAHLCCCRVCETRRIRTQRGAARPMTRDARLSALHRGDFRPGAALPSPALPPDPYSDAPRSQVIMPGGRCPGQPAYRSETSGDGR
jgi:hypothetical protein